MELALPRTVDPAPSRSVDRDPFRTLGLPYDADADAVRRAFRRRALETHPDRGGAPADFHDVRTAHDTLARDLEGERRRWAPPPPGQAYADALDPRVYPTCTVRLGRDRSGRRTATYETGRRPAGWLPRPEPPPGGRCQAGVAAADGAPAFGVWVVPTGPHTFRCVFGPPP